MPTMVHMKSGQQRIVPGRARSQYEQRGWQVAPPPDEPEEVSDGRPAVNDPKSEWVDYAEAIGIDTDGLTKAEVIDAVDA